MMDHMGRMMDDTGMGLGGVLALLPWRASSPAGDELQRTASRDGLEEGRRPPLSVLHRASQNARCARGLWL